MAFTCMHTARMVGGDETNDSSGLGPVCRLRAGGMDLFS